MDLKTPDLDRYIKLELVLCTNYGWKQIPNFSEKEECKVCTESMEGKYVLRTACDHNFCQECALGCIIPHKRLRCVDCDMSFDFYSNINLNMDNSDKTSSVEIGVYGSDDQWDYESSEEYIRGNHEEDYDNWEDRAPSPETPTSIQPFYMV